MHYPGIQIIHQHREQKPVCCKEPQHGPYESNIIMEQVQYLLNNVWTENCVGPLGISIF